MAALDGTGLIEEGARGCVEDPERCGGGEFGYQLLTRDVM
jgi:hypothetical protein